MKTVSIISGIYKNRSLLTPGEGTHPMGSRERLAIFNSLSDQVLDGVVLDAFAGSGALGIEALSRGAKMVYFVEHQPRAARTIAQNLESLGVPNTQYEIIKEKVKNVNFPPIFDVIFADPPYDNFDIGEVFGIANSLKTEGIFVFSHPKMEKLELPGLKLEKSKKYAASYIDFFRKV